MLSNSQHVRSGEGASNLGWGLFRNINGISRLHHAQTSTRNELGEEPVEPVRCGCLQRHGLWRPVSVTTESIERPYRQGLVTDDNKHEPCKMHSFLTAQYVRSQLKQAYSNELARRQHASPDSHLSRIERNAAA